MYFIHFYTVLNSGVKYVIIIEEKILVKIVMVVKYVFITSINVFVIFVKAHKYVIMIKLNIYVVFVIKKHSVFIKKEQKCVKSVILNYI